MLCFQGPLGVPSYCLLIRLSDLYVCESPLCLRLFTSSSEQSKALKWWQLASKRKRMALGDAGQIKHAGDGSGAAAAGPSSSTAAAAADHTWAAAWRGELGHLEGRIRNTCREVALTYVGEQTAFEREKKKWVMGTGYVLHDADTDMDMTVTCSSALLFVTFTYCRRLVCHKGNGNRGGCRRRQIPSSMFHIGIELRNESCKVCVQEDKERVRGRRRG